MPRRWHLKYTYMHEILWFIFVRKYVRIFTYHNTKGIGKVQGDVAEQRAKFERQDILLLALSLVIATGIFLLDISTPQGVAAGVPYIAVVFLGAWLPWRYGILLLAAIGTTLTIFGYLFSVPGSAVWMVVINRGLALFAIWVTAFLLIQRRRAEEALKAAHDGLETRVVERTAELERTNTDLQAEIAERVRVEQELRQSEARFKDFANTASDWFWELDSQFRFTMDTGSRSLAGLDTDDILGKTRWQLPGIDPEDEIWPRHRADLEAHKSIRNFEFNIHVENGEQRYALVNGKPMYDSQGNFIGYRGTGSDVTDLRKAEERLHQAQKMEAVGQLTGGVAHDFNNLLAIIMGNAEILSEELGPGNARVQAVLSAANRGADLTRRLLAFSRRQPLRPEPLDLGTLVTGMMDMLRRSLGTAIDIKFVAGNDLWTAAADPGLLENALLNLAINARDAMSGNGILVIETSNVVLDESYAAPRTDVVAGDYVMLTVTDTGDGMSPEVLEHVFEPFFTTKEVGKGTGLGLSMVFGFAKQSGGHVAIYSEPGKGTTAKLYLPRTGEKAKPVEVSATKVMPHGHGETVLVVEDDEDVRELAVLLLEELGYQVLEAADGKSGLVVLDESPGVDLLLVDLVLAGGMSGRNLANEAVRRNAGLKLLFMSGYPENAAQVNGWLDKGADLLQKPFRKRDLATKVRDVLDRVVD